MRDLVVDDATDNDIDESRIEAMPNEELIEKIKTQVYLVQWYWQEEDEIFPREKQLVHAFLMVQTVD